MVGLSLFGRHPYSVDCAHDVVQFFFDTAEDFSLRWQYSIFLRIIRLFAAGGAAILLPAFYIAVTLYHQEAIPVNLLFR